eukprot:scaffold5853_cov112-Isochrysis_galbana.AAC.4
MLQPLFSCHDVLALADVAVASCQSGGGGGGQLAVAGADIQSGSGGGDTVTPHVLLDSRWSQPSRDARTGSPSVRTEDG